MFRRQRWDSMTEYPKLDRLVNLILYILCSNCITYVLASLQRLQVPDQIQYRTFTVFTAVHHGTSFLSLSYTANGQCSARISHLLSICLTHCFLDHWWQMLGCQSAKCFRLLLTGSATLLDFIVTAMSLIICNGLFLLSVHSWSTITRWLTGVMLWHAGRH